MRSVGECIDRFDRCCGVCVQTKNAGSNEVGDASEERAREEETRAAESAASTSRGGLPCDINCPQWTACGVYTDPDSFPNRTHFSLIDRPRVLDGQSKSKGATRNHRHLGQTTGYDIAAAVSASTSHQQREDAAGGGKTRGAAAAAPRGAARHRRGIFPSAAAAVGPGSRNTARCVWGVSGLQLVLAATKRG